VENELLTGKSRNDGLQSVPVGAAHILPSSHSLPTQELHCWGKRQGATFGLTLVALLSIIGESVLSPERRSMLCVLRFNPVSPPSPVDWFLDSAVGRTADEISVSRLECTPAF